MAFWIILAVIVLFLCFDTIGDALSFVIGLPLIVAVVIVLECLPAWGLMLMGGWRPW